MSFMPAEEFDDYNSDDGFTGEEEFLKQYLDIQNFESAQNVSPQKNGSCEASSPISQPLSTKLPSTRQFPASRNGHEGFPNRNGFSDRSQTFYSEEDFKLAAIKGNVEVVKKCLNQGLSVNHPLHSGWTALMYASNNAKSALVEFLMKEGADTNFHADMYTALMCACSATIHSEENVLACAKLLIDGGASVNAKDRYHSTPLMLACRAGKLETVKLLVEQGVNVNEQDSRGWTALTMATQKSHKAVVMALLDAGADANIKHRDKLTVKDLAAHLPTDEMLALLERRPFVANGQGDEFTTVPFKDTSNHCILDSGDSSMKSVDLRYGELELFLYGLDLPHLLALFRRQLIDLPLLLTLTEQDLTNAGVDQVGARKKILDASQAVHKRQWEASSLVSIHFNKCISCADAVAMLANASKHVRYITSTTTYVKEQIRRHPEGVMQPTDRVNPSQLTRHVEDSVKNVNALKEQLLGLQTLLKKEMTKHSTDPADLIVHREKSRWTWSRKLTSFSIACASLGTLGILIWKHDRLLSLVK